ncbi:unnamed protein product, partial [marine sediment metagenome]
MDSTEMSLEKTHLFGNWELEDMNFAVDSQTR